MRLKVTVFFALVSVAGVCDKVPERGWERGYFRPIEETNKPWSLPAGLSLRSCVGAEDEDTLVSLLPLVAKIFNETDKRMTATLPAGLVFEPGNYEYQYMIILQPFVLTVPGDMDTTVLLPTFCCNEDLDEPDDESNYTIHSQEWEVEMNELVDLLKGKRLVGYQTLELVQSALFEITDGNGLTDTMRSKLASLP
ncbi:MAG: hypothetical protein ABIK43_00245 [candidate division WOR-3 bacterium]